MILLDLGIHTQTFAYKFGHAVGSTIVPLSIGIIVAGLIVWVVVRKKK